jgi:hypothetical protein
MCRVSAVCTALTTQSRADQDRAINAEVDGVTFGLKLTEFDGTYSINIEPVTSSRTTGHGTASNTTRDWMRVSRRLLITTTWHRGSWSAARSRLREMLRSARSCVDSLRLGASAPSTRAIGNDAGATKPTHIPAPTRLHQVWIGQFEHQRSQDPRQRRPTSHRRDQPHSYSEVGASRSG